MYFGFLQFSQFNLKVYQVTYLVVTAGMVAASVRAVEKRRRNVTRRPVLTMDSGASGASVVRAVTEEPRDE